jgi:hypothetical protein
MVIINLKIQKIMCKIIRAKLAKNLLQSEVKNTLQRKKNRTKINKLVKKFKIRFKIRIFLIDHLTTLKHRRIILTKVTFYRKSRIIILVCRRARLLLIKSVQHLRFILDRVQLNRRNHTQSIKIKKYLTYNNFKFTLIKRWDQ